MTLISFDNLTAHYGEVFAWHCLVEIERAAGMRPNQFSNLDPEMRLSIALRAQDSERLGTAMA